LSIHIAGTYRLDGEQPLSEENSKSQAPPDLKIGPNKSQISISNDQNIHRSRIASFRKPGSAGDDLSGHDCKGTIFLEL
jgi:hypothetical protein